MARKRWQHSSGSGGRQKMHGGTPPETAAARAAGTSDVRPEDLLVDGAAPLLRTDDPLEAEMFASGLVGLLSAGPFDDEDEPAPLPTVVDALGSMHRAEALAILRALAAALPEMEGARRGAEALAGSGVPECRFPSDLSDRQPPDLCVVGIVSGARCH